MTQEGNKGNESASKKFHMPGISKIILLPFSSENHILKAFPPSPLPIKYFPMGKCFPNLTVQYIFDMALEHIRTQQKIS